MVSLYEEVGLHLRLLFQLKKFLDLLEQTFQTLSVLKNIQRASSNRFLGTRPRYLHPLGVNQVLTFCICNKWPGDANTAVQEPNFEQLSPTTDLSYCIIILLDSFSVLFFREISPIQFSLLNYLLICACNNTNYEVDFWTPPIAILSHLRERFMYCFSLMSNKPILL